MKSKVLNRPMFLDVENVGIMQGFKDDDLPGEDMYETGQMIDRTPGSPEILMNNLRGDMRSIDARVEELAQLVGDDVAMETPPEVLALLQPVLAQQEGIASLPAGMPEQPMDPSMMPPSPMGAAMPAPDMGMMPPDAGMMPPMDPSMMPPMDPSMMPPPDAGMMPQGPMPTDQAPLQMAQGGYVQRFRDGSDEEGVTPASESLDPSSARALLANVRSQQPMLPTLSEEFQNLLPTYQEALGAGDQSMTRAQMLFDIAQAGLNLAAGTDAQGRPVQGSFASRLAGASQALPERIADRAGQMRQEEQGIRLAALKGAEGSVAARLEALKEQSPFGEKNWEWQILDNPELLDRWSRGEVTETEDFRVQAALSKLTQPRTEFRIDPVYGTPVSMQVMPEVPEYIKDVMARRGQTPAAAPAPAAPPVPGRSAASPLSASGAYVSPEDKELAQAVAEGSALPTESQVIANVPGRLGEIAAPGTIYDLYDPNENTFFNLAGKGTGPISVSRRLLNRVPLLGEFVDADQEIQAAQFMTTGINRVARALGETERFGSIEKQQILDQLDLLPSFVDRAEAYHNRVIGLDNMLLKAMIEMEESALDMGLPPAVRKETLGKMDIIQQVRAMLGAPPRVYRVSDFQLVAPGSPFIFENRLRYRDK